MCLHGILARQRLVLFFLSHALTFCRLFLSPFAEIRLSFLNLGASAD